MCFDRCGVASFLWYKRQQSTRIFNGSVESCNIILLDMVNLLGGEIDWEIWLLKSHWFWCPLAFWFRFIKTQDKLTLIISVLKFPVLLWPASFFFRTKPTLSNICWPDQRVMFGERGIVLCLFNIKLLDTLFTYIYIYYMYKGNFLARIDRIMSDSWVIYQRTWRC
jgi:hypothetical protein